VAFKVSNGAQSAEITVIDLSASAPNVADPLANVNQWRSGIGLKPIQQEQLEGTVQKIDVGGKPSDYVEVMPSESVPAEAQVKEATIAAIVPAGDKIWFLKMRGDRKLLEAQREDFKAFLKSVQFKTDGAGDGNQ
jgi:hypothetical protein